MRPGSITVGDGYEKGASLRGGLIRPFDDTLRCSAVTFLRPPEGGLDTRWKFEYMKGYRVAYRGAQVNATKTFTFLPVRSNRLWMDVSLLVASLAIERGVLPSAEETLGCKSFYVPKTADVENQAIFLAANNKGQLNGQPMRSFALNCKLQEICKLVGIQDRNTMYSWRRTAIVETRRTHGTEMAKELANHSLDFSLTALMAYDDEGLADMDLTSTRLNEEKVPHSYLRELFGQIRLCDASSTLPTPAVLAQNLTKYVDEAMQKDDPYILTEESIASL